MTVVEILKAARARIATPEHWCQGKMAVDAEGNSVPVASPDAVRWCALGALYAVGARGREDQDAYAALLKQVHPMAFAPLSTFNNTHSHSEVVAIFDRAIAATEGA